MTINDTNQEALEDLSPDAVMTVFSKSRLGLSLVLTLIAHALVIGATSIPFVFAQAKRSENTEPSQPTAESPRDSSVADTPPSEGELKDSGNDPSPDKQALTPVEQQTSETIEPEKIPEPDLGISIEDTNF